MRKTHSFRRLIVASGLALCSTSAIAAQTVTVENFVRAETDITFKRYVAQGAFGKFLHLRAPTPIDKQDVIRMNRDTLYSVGVFDLTQPITIIKPASGGRFQSMAVINEDHSALPTVHEAGHFTFTQKKVGTRYVFVAFRTFIDPAQPDDIKAANALQDKIAVVQANAGSFQIPDWDEVSLGKVRDAINALAVFKADMSSSFGDKSKLNPVDHLIATAYAWGGNPKEAAVYSTVTPKENDGNTPYVLTVKDVPVRGFWSITVYNEKGYMEKNSRDAYSFNNVTAKKDADGAVTIHFGGDPGASNYLPITKGWNYAVRLYQPKREIIDGKWRFPEAQPMK